jgi:hypothetical protein
MADKLFPTDYTEVTTTQTTDFTPVYREWEELYKIKTESLKWPKWDTGAQGIQWIKWDKWDTWSTGATGATWPQWAQWPQWIKWDKWDTGAQWPQGPAWATWPQGPTGPQWPQGPAWATWPDWEDGTDWNWIASITTNKVGKTTTVTITEDDSTVTTFDVEDWADWEWVWDMLLDWVQSVTWAKTFDKDKLLVKGTSTGTTNLTTANTSANNYTATFPAKDWTVAMTADLPDITGKVDKSTYDANTIIKADSDNTPAALTVWEQTLVGRKTWWVITALTPTEVRTMINVADWATANTKATWAEVDTWTDDSKFVTAKAIEDSSYIKSWVALPLAWWTMTGDITLWENTWIALDPAGSADEKWTGITCTWTAWATLAVWDLIYLDATAWEWMLADADAASTSWDVPLWLCILAANDWQATNILLMWTIRSAAFPASIALWAPVYVSTTAWDIQADKPSWTDDVVRRVWRAITTEPNTIYFNPSNDYATIV